MIVTRSLNKKLLLSNKDMTVRTDIVTGHRIVVDPEGVGEICNLLLTNHADVGWVCSRGSLINMFSKYKPVILSNVIDSTVINGVSQINSDNTWKSTATWWKGNTGDCGIELPFLTMRDISDIVDHCDGSANGWVYNPPTGGTNAPYRLIDFNYYDHDAVCPVSNFTLYGKVVSNQAGGKVEAGISIRSSSSYAISLMDMATLVGKYFSVYFLRKGSSNSRQASCEAVIGASGGDHFEVSTQGWTTGTWLAYPLLSEFPLNGESVANSYYPLPYTSPIEFEVVATTLFVVITSFSVDTSNPLYVQDGQRGYKVTASVGLTNIGSSSITLTNNTWMTTYRNSQGGNVDEYSGSIANQTVASGTTVNINITGVVSIDVYDSEKPRLWVTFNSMGYKDWVELHQ